MLSYWVSMGVNRYLLRVVVMLVINGNALGILEVYSHLRCTVGNEPFHSGLGSS